ncbi:unnamed protein product [Malus baccata var. baccata]
MSSHSTIVVDDLKNLLMSATKEFKEVLTMMLQILLFANVHWLPCQLLVLQVLLLLYGLNHPLHHRHSPRSKWIGRLVLVQDSYIQSRAEALQNVEYTIHELSNIFNQLATLNMEDTLTNIEGAQGALLKYLNSISSIRWLMIKIFFVLIYFLMGFLFFFFCGMVICRERVREMEGKKMITIFIDFKVDKALCILFMSCFCFFECPRGHKQA